MNKPHTISHIEIPAPDLGKAMHFYSNVFAWKIEVVQEGIYAYFIIGCTQTGGGFDASLKPAEDKCGPQITIDVEDINEALAKIKNYGGNVTMEKIEIEGGHGFYACFQDPNGNHLQIHGMI